ncbi:MAG: antitermination protein NusA, partial [Eggerthellaceae bacterium]|nr:antitermination protein NusA [Eggerthellaceae bacterium]
DPAKFVAASLAPADVVSVTMVEGEKACRVIVPDDQLSLAIGKEGQNARLAARLTGWHIDIKSASFAGEPAEQENPLLDEDELAEDDNICAYVGADGVRCRNHARPGSRYCGVHAMDEE